MDEGSLKAHPHRMKIWLEAQNMMNPNWGQCVDWYKDIEYSGKNIDRPEFRRMLRDIEKGKINAILVTEISRLTRSIKDWCHLDQFFKKHNVTIFSLREKLDTSTAAGNMIVNMLVSHAQFERETTVERLKENSISRAQRGLATGGWRILGYDHNSQKVGYLTINKTEAALVQLIFEKYLEIGSMGGLCDYLNEKNYKTKMYTLDSGKRMGGKKFTVSSVFKILNNYTYIAKREVNQKNKYKDQDKMPQRYRYQIVDAVWKGIISVKLFYTVQNLIEKNADNFRNFSLPSEEEYLLQKKQQDTSRLFLDKSTDFVCKSRGEQI